MALSLVDWILQIVAATPAIFALGVAIFKKISETFRENGGDLKKAILEGVELIERRQGKPKRGKPKEPRRKRANTSNTPKKTDLNKVKH